MDTSAYLALAECQPEALACLASLDARRIPLYTTSAVVAETHRRLLFDHSWSAARQFIDDLYGGRTKIVRPTENDEQDAVSLLDEFSHLPMTFCDALSMAYMRRVGIFQAFTLDHRHFLAASFIVVPPLYL